MEKSKKRSVIPLAWFFYLVIVFEILYMISPFALYYYSSYGPSLNFLNSSPLTSWLTQFILPHYTTSSSALINSMAGIGRKLFFAGLILFFYGAIQIYYSKFAKKGAVTKGLYRFIRHPQYTAFAITGLGLLLFWPRFIVLLMYMLMLIVYYLLARKEEQECEDKYGESYISYKKNTSMFLPVKIRFLNRLPKLPASLLKRRLYILLFCLIYLTVSVTIGMAVRDYTIDSISTCYDENYAAISVLRLEREKIHDIVNVSKRATGLKQMLKDAGITDNDRLILYIVPIDWIIPDLPMDPMMISIKGHYEPAKDNQERFKVLFAKARLHDHKNVSGRDIIRKAFGLDPAAVVEMDIASGEILKVRKAPDHVLWGDIPTPIF
ncbi:methyltransferase family protein [candidate division KSB1 bacterium]